MCRYVPITGDAVVERMDKSLLLGLCSDGEGMCSTNYRSISLLESE